MDAIKTWTTQQLRDYIYDNSKTVNQMTTIEYNIFVAAKAELKSRVKGKGWSEKPDHTGKAPKHKAVATKKKLSGTARKPMSKSAMELSTTKTSNGTYIDKVMGAAAVNEVRSGKSIAFVKPNGEVEYTEDWAKTDNEVQEVIAKVVAKYKKEGYGWIITRDFLFEENEKHPIPGLPNKSEVGVIGGHDTPFSKEDIIKHGRLFRMKDDDGELYYEGRLLGGNGFEPLDDFGEGNAGCTSIWYKENRVWVEL